MRTVLLLGFGHVALELVFFLLRGIPGELLSPGALVGARGASPAEGEALSAYTHASHVGVPFLTTPFLTNNQLIWDRFGVDPGSVSNRFLENVGSIQGRFGVG